jgi:hypothetical protein
MTRSARAFVARWKFVLIGAVVAAYLSGPTVDFEWRDSCPSGGLIQDYPNVPGRRAECFSQGGTYLGLAGVTQKRIGLYVTRPALRVFNLEFAPLVVLHGFGICDGPRSCD